MPTRQSVTLADRSLIIRAVALVTVLIGLSGCALWSGGVHNASRPTAPEDSTTFPTPGVTGSPVARAQLLGRWDVVRVTDNALAGCDCRTVNRVAYVTFDEDGAVTGSDSTNTWSSRFTASHSTLRIAVGSASTVGLAPSASVTQKELQAAFADLMSGGKVYAARFGIYLLLNPGRYALLLARPARYGTP